MAIPVTVADDSMMSRKAVLRAIPEDWDVEVSEAKNG
ncbi:response regulator, partial [Pseudoalteromonas phenolica]